MKKFIFSLSLFLSFSTFVDAQIDATINTTAIGLGATSTSTNYKFTYQNNSIPHYGVSWFVDQDVAGGAPMGYLSGFAGLKFFTAGTVRMSVINGNVGIGTTTPDENLVVNGNIKSILNTYLPAKNVATIKQLGYSGPTGAMNWTLRGVYQYPNGVIGNADGGDLDIIKSWNGNTILGTKTDGSPLGNVGIGIINPQNKLDVNGRIHSQSVVIDMNGWPDYVFKKDYQLPSLSDVKAYIDQNQHLPEIPSEQQIAKDGLNLGEMNKLLMKKVEELTLYLIEKDKQAQKQQDEIDLLKAQMKKLIKP